MPKETPEDPRAWQRFARTVETVSASALAEVEIAEAREAPPRREEFIALAAASSAPVRDAVTLRNGRRDLTVTLAPEGDGVRIRVEASGYQTKRGWSGASAELLFERSRLGAQLRFDANARAETIVTGAGLEDLARDKISLVRLINR